MLLIDNRCTRVGSEDGATGMGWNQPPFFQKSESARTSSRPRSWQAMHTARRSAATRPKLTEDITCGEDLSSCESSPFCCFREVLGAIPTCFRDGCGTTRIDEATIVALVVPLRYLMSENPRTQSGTSEDMAKTRRMDVDSIRFRLVEQEQGIRKRLRKGIRQEQFTWI